MRKLLPILILLIIPFTVQAGFWTDAWNSFWGVEELAAVPTLRVEQGGTDIGSYDRGDVLVASTTNEFYRLATGTDGYFLRLTDGFPAWGRVATSAGGGGGTGQWSTTTGMIYYDTGIVVVGANATSATGYDFEVSGSSLFDNITAATGTFSGLQIGSYWFPAATGTTGYVLELQPNGSLAWAADDAGVGGEGQWTTTTAGYIYYLNDVVIGDSATSGPFWFNTTTEDLRIAGDIHGNSLYTASNVYTAHLYDNFSAGAVDMMGDPWALSGLSFQITDGNLLFASTGDSYIYFDNIAEYMMWDDGGARFFFSDDIATNDTITGSNITVASTTNWNTAFGLVNLGHTNWDTAYTIVNASSSNWDTAYGYINASSSNWNQAYNWGDHALVGYWDSLDDMVLTEGQFYIGNPSNDPVATSGIFMNDSGFIGIGTTSPDYALSVESTANQIAGFYTNQSVGGITLNSSGAGFSCWSEDNGKTAIGDSCGVSTGNLVIDTAGNVGLNVTSPSTKLEVVGTATIDGLQVGSYWFPTATGTSYYVLKLQPDGSLAWSADTSGGGGGGSVWSTSTDLVYTSNTVLVGGAATTSAGYALEIIGSSLFDDVNISGALTYASATNWDTAYGFVNASSSKWNQAYNWGDHDSVGYLTTVIPDNITASNATTDEYVLTYEATGNTFEWQADANTGATTLNELGDVTIAGPNDANILIYESTPDARWEDKAVSGDCTISNQGVIDCTIGAEDISYANATTDEFCLTYESTGNTFEWQTCGAGGGGNEVWGTTSTGFMYPVVTTYDVALGDNATKTASFFFDVSENDLYVGAGGAGDSVIDLYASGTHAWTFGMDYSDSRNFKISTSTDFSSHAFKINITTGAIDVSGSLTTAGNIAGLNITTSSTTNWNTAFGHMNASSSNWSKTYDIVNASSSKWNQAYTHSLLTNEHLDWTADLGATNIHAGNYTDTNTQLTEDQVEDFAGGMFTGNVETLITATYHDSTGTIDLVVDNNLHNYSWANVVDADITNTLTCSNLVAGSAVVDISTETNLATSTGISLTDDTLGLVLGAIDHDSLLNYAANEHINYTASTTYWDRTWTLVNASSTNWNTAYGLVNLGHTNWDTAYTIVNASSSNWNQAYTQRGSVLGGSYLTYAGGDLDLDEEIYDGSISMAFYNATDTADGVLQKEWEHAVTITKIICSTDSGTINIQFDERAEGTPNTGGTDVMNHAMICDNNSNSTTTFSNAGIAANAPLSMDIDSMSAADLDLRVHIYFTITD